jgi:zinc transporter, ZIP family
MLASSWRARPPVEILTIERFVLEPGLITAHVRNSGPTELTIALASVNDSVWPAIASPSNVVPRLSTATVTLHYPWVQGEAYEVVFFTENALVFRKDIPVAFLTPRPTPAMLGSFTLIGLYVGVLPVALGLLWLPALKRAGPRIMLFLLALTAGVLAVLGIDTLAEALEQGAALPGPFQGLVLVAMGALGAVLGLAAITAAQQELDRDRAGRRLSIAYRIALGIGLHNLGEGLAIGAAYALGEIALGSFLVIGFIIQNITEGVAIIAPILRDRPRLVHLAAMGLLAGGPTILGTWIGGFTYSAVFATFFLALGVGAILQVLVEVGRLTVRETARLQAPLVSLAGVVVGMLLLYATGLLVK